MKRLLILIIFVGCNVEKSQKININDFHEVISVNDAKALSDSVIDWEENHKVFLEFFSNYIIRNNDDLQFSKFNLKLILIAILAIIISTLGIVASVNYWLSNEPLSVNFKILGRYFVPSITLILFSFQTVINVILFNFLKRK